MATLEARGYVSKPEAKTTKGGKAYSQFVLGVKQVDKGFQGKPDKVTWANFMVKDFKNASPPEPKSYATVKGFLKVRDYEKDGQKRQALEVVAQELEVSPPMGGGNASEPATPAPAADGAASDPFDDIPF